MPLIDTTLHNLFEPYGIGRNLDVAIEHSQQIAARYCRLTPSRNFLYDAYNLVFHGEKAYHPLDVKKYVNALRNNKFHLSNNRIALLASYANVDAMGRQARFADRPPTIGTQFSQLFFGPKPVPPSPEFFEAPRIDELLMCLFDVIRRPLLFQVVKARGIFYRLDRYDFRRRGARVTELGERLEKAIWPILYMNDRVQDGPSRIDVLNALGQSIAYLETIEIDDKSRLRTR